MVTSQISGMAIYICLQNSGPYWIRNIHRYNGKTGKSKIYFQEMALFHWHFSVNPAHTFSKVLVYILDLRKSKKQDQKLRERKR